MIKLNNVSKTYKAKKDNLLALNNISLELPDAGLIFICGENGSGKSTLLNCISLLDEHYDGDIYLNDISYKNISNKEKRRIRRNYFGYIFQKNNLINCLNCKQNINISSYIFHKNKCSAFDDLTIKHYPKQMSGGQQQKTAIYRAINDDKAILICDEPTAALDYDNTISTFEELKRISKDKLVLCVSHNMELVEKYADRIIELSSGKIIADRVMVKNEYRLKKWKISKNRLSFFGLLKLGISFFKKNIFTSFIYVFLMIVLLLAISLFISYLTFNPYKTIKDNINDISNYSPNYQAYTSYNSSDTQSVEITLSDKLLKDCDRYAKNKYNMAILDYYDGISFIKDSGIAINEGYIGKTTLIKYFNTKFLNPKKPITISFTTDTLQSFNIRIKGTFYGSGIRCDYKTIEYHKINKIAIKGGLWLNNIFENNTGLISTKIAYSGNSTYQKMKYLNETVTYYPFSYINTHYSNYIKKLNLELDDDSVIISRSLSRYNDIEGKKYFLNFDNFSNNDFLDSYINMNTIFSNGMKIASESSLYINECGNNYVFVSDEKFEQIKKDFSIFTGVVIDGNNKNEIANLFLNENYSFKGEFGSRIILNEIVRIKNGIKRVESIINKIVIIIASLIIFFSLLWTYLVFRYDKIKIALLRTFGLSRLQAISPSLLSFFILNILAIMAVFILFGFAIVPINSFLAVFKFDINILTMNSSVVLNIILLLMLQIIMFIMYYFIGSINKTLKESFD